MRKKIDSRVRTLVENGIKTRHRSIVVLVGDKGRDQVVNLHYMMSKAVVKSRPTVLWCYKTELHFSSHRKKRMNQIKKMQQRGLMDPEKEDPFSMFVASTNIRYCYYADTHKVLGNTFGMCVLQDFEALTPNLLARTIETVEGGGIVVLLVSSMESLSKLYTLTMDVHARFRTESHQEVVGRFNERFILSLANCKGCLLLDDELNILPTSTHSKNLKAVGDVLPEEGKEELKELIESLADTLPAGPLVARCRTIDQAKAVVTFLDAASEKTLRSTVALTASRGRGKSAALGTAIAGAVAMGYANIFVTAPSPENLHTLFEFVFKGLDALDYKEHIDYDLVESNNPAFGKAIVRVNVFRNHRQTIQYVQPQHYERVSQAELLVIDEAAAIPLPLVKKLLGPYLVFLCSIVNGYEGTGRSLSLKLIQQLREQGAKLSTTASKAPGGRLFKEVELAEPIRYAPNDPVEKWLHGLLCLNAAEHVTPVTKSLPHPSECELFAVNRDALFSYHKASELLLQRMMSLYVASHYKNSPNDLQLMSDAPAHRLFVLLAPVDQTTNELPEILCVVQVALEGAISKQSAQATLSKGHAPQGDLIPWTVSQQYQDAEFPTLSGLRVVRIATHPGVQRAGYGTRALQLLVDYYEGKMTDLTESDPTEDGYIPEPSAKVKEVEDEDGGLSEEKLKPRADLPPLLTALSERPPERLNWIGTSFGLTAGLMRFWSKSGFKPVYLRQTASDITGECSCILLKELSGVASGPTPGWLGSFVGDFKVRLLAFLAGAHRDMAPGLALGLLDPKIRHEEEETDGAVAAGDGDKDTMVHRSDGAEMSPFDLKRLQSYASSLVDHHLIQDLVPPLARAYFSGRIPVNLSYGQTAILCSVGLQHQDISKVEEALNLPANQILALFNKSLRKIHAHLKARAVKAIEASLPRIQEFKATPHAIGLEEDLEHLAKETSAAMKAKQQAVLSALGDLEQYAIKGEAADWDEVGKKGVKTGTISVKGTKKEPYTPGSAKKETPGKKTPGKEHGSGKKRQKDDKESGSTKKKKPRSNDNV